VAVLGLYSEEMHAESRLDAATLTVGAGQRRWRA